MLHWLRLGLSLTGAAAIALVVAGGVVYGSLLRKGIVPWRGRIDKGDGRELAYQARASCR